MEPVFAVQPIPFEPLAWPRRPSSEQLAAYARSCPAPPAPGAVQDCDARWCGVVLAAADRQIDSLRRALVRRDTYEPGDPDALAAPPTERKAYAPAPIGKPAPVQNEPPPEQPAAQTAPLYHVTNLGTLLDVLA